MAQPSSVFHCGECGALVKLSDTRCWFCSRVLVDGQTAPGRDTAGVTSIVVMILAALAMIPTVFVGFFITCSAFVDHAISPGHDNSSTIVVTITTVVIVLIVLIAVIACMGAKVRRS